MLDRLTHLRSKLNQHLAKRSFAIQQVRSEKKALRQGLIQESNVSTAIQIAQEVAEQVQETAHREIARMVTRCLRTIFGKQAYKFKINFEKKRGKTEARIVLVRKGMEIDPKRACGGGVLDVVSFALRLVCLVLSTPKLRKLMVMDESFKHLSSNYRERVGELLITLSRELGIQFVLATHARELVIGKQIQIEKAVKREVP